MVPTWTYVKDQSGINTNLFIGSTIQVSKVAGTEVEMVQKTDYPWDGKVAITVNPGESREFAVRIRIPNRDVSVLYQATPNADGLKDIKLNGQPVQSTEDRGYAIIHREWKKGDTVSFEIPMIAQKITASDKIEATRGQMAFRYGPLVYCVERVDQNIQRPINPEAPLSVEWQPQTLNGIKVLKGKWADGEELLAIPYYARANREDAAGFGEFGGPGATGGGDGNSNENKQGPSSKVWLPVK
jgi:DUF1680 family protein